MKRLAVASLAVVGLALPVPAASAAPTPRAADAAAERAATDSFEDARQFRATCNPTRSPRTGNQLRKRWRCDMQASALPDDYLRLAEEGYPRDRWPWTFESTVQWSDGEWEATSIGNPKWNPRLSLEVPRLGTVTARLLARRALRGEGFGWIVGPGSRTSCKRMSRTTVRCTFTSTQGDTSGKSRIRIAMVTPRGDNEWNYSWTTRIYDNYCYAVLNRPASRCVEVDRVR